MADVDKSSSLTLSLVIEEVFDDGVGLFDDRAGNFDDLHGIDAEVAVAISGTDTLGLTASEAKDLFGASTRADTLNVGEGTTLDNFLTSTRSATLDIEADESASGFGETSATDTLQVSVGEQQTSLGIFSRTDDLDLEFSLGEQRWGDEQYSQSTTFTDVTDGASDRFTDVVG